MILSIVINAVIVLWTSYTMYWYFRIHQPEKPLKRKLHIFRFFTYLSNDFSAIVSLMILIYEMMHLSSGAAALPDVLMILRFMSTVSVVITFLTVVFFLAPTIGIFLLYKEDNLYMHVVGPALSVIEFLLVEKCLRFSSAQIIFGMIPMLAYACLYLYKVVKTGEERGGWPDFYGFNRNGMWKISCTAMIAAALAVSAVLALAHNALL